MKPMLYVNWCMVHYLRSALLSVCWVSSIVLISVVLANTALTHLLFAQLYFALACLSDICVNRTVAWMFLIRFCLMSDYEARHNYKETISKWVLYVLSHNKKGFLCTPQISRFYTVRQDLLRHYLHLYVSVSSLIFDSCQSS